LGAKGRQIFRGRERKKLVKDLELQRAPAGGRLPLVMAEGVADAEPDERAQSSIAVMGPVVPATVHKR
jgi:hypothetical protein